MTSRQALRCKNKEIPASHPRDFNRPRFGEYGQVSGNIQFFKGQNDRFFLFNGFHLPGYIIDAVDGYGRDLDLGKSFITKATTSLV